MPSAESAGGTRRSQRDELETLQTRLVAAVVAGADPPPGMDADRIAVQAAALMRKRARAVAHVQPELAIALGSAFLPAFSAYAASRPSPGSAGTDAAQFAHYLRGTGQRWSREVRREARRVAGLRRASGRPARSGPPEGLA